MDKVFHEVINQVISWILFSQIYIQTDFIMQQEEPPPAGD